MAGKRVWQSGTSGGKLIANGTDVFFHVAPNYERASIQEEGLIVSPPRFTGIVYPPGIYLFSHSDAAAKYLTIEEREEDDIYGPDGITFDIWEVIPDSGTELFQDPFSNDESGLGLYSVYSVTPLTRISLEGFNSPSPGLREVV